MIEIILKQLGLNPADIKKQAEDGVIEAKKIVDDFRKQLDTIEQQNNRILFLLGEKHVEANFIMAETKLLTKPL